MNKTKTKTKTETDAKTETKTDADTNAKPKTNTEMQKTGRRRLVAGLKKDHPVTFVVTTKQYDILCAAALADEKKLGTWVRSVVFSAISSPDEEIGTEEQ